MITTSVVPGIARGDQRNGQQRRQGRFAIAAIDGTKDGGSIARIFRTPRWLVLAVLISPAVGADTWFTNQGSVLNTRHNLTQRPPVGESYGELMDNYRNDYAEVCVYCHTPHGANASVAAPLWNRNLPATTYTTYDKLGTGSLTQASYQPGAASLPCLSCHDGQQAVDAVINMPGSGSYSATPDNAFLNTWDNPRSSLGGAHLSLDANIAWGPSGFAGIEFPTKVSCLTCHSPAVEGKTLSGAEPDFTLVALGTDLRNDHPVGVLFPTVTGNGTDWKTPTGSKTVGLLVTRFFDEDGDTHMDKDDVRLYDNGNGAAVECGSCHDPHGVPGPGGTFNATFLRKSNGHSGVCLTCHSK